MGKQKLAVFDIDGTLFRSGLYRELVYELMRRGAFQEQAVKDALEKEKAWRKLRHDDSFLEFDETLLDLLESRLPHITVADYENAVRAVIDTHQGNVYHFTANLAKRLKSEGYFLIALSGSQIELVQLFAKYYDFDACAGLIHERDGDCFTGKSKRLYNQKHVRLDELINQHNLTISESYGIGDTAGDISVLECVENPIAFNPEKKLLAHAQKRGWDIVLERKGCTYQLRKTGDAYTMTELRGNA